MELKFKKLDDEHLEKVRNWRNSPEIKKYMYTEPEITPEQQKKWYNKIKKDDSKKYWVVNVDGEDIGLVCIFDIDRLNKRCYWGYYIGEPSARGKGIGKQIELNVLKYVFEKMNLNKLCCEVLEVNEKVVMIHEKYGSRIEGVLREHIHKNGTFHNVVVMSILSKEWGMIKDKYDVLEADIEE